MKQKFNVTGMTCTACSAPHDMFHAAGAPDLFICSGELNSPGIEVLPPAKRSRRATRRGWAEHVWAGKSGESL